MTSLVGLVGLGLSVILTGLTPAALFPVAVFASAMLGLMMSFANGPLMAVLQANVDPAMQGRVFTLLSSAATAMMPLGLAVAGPVADTIGVRLCFLLGGGITLLIGLGGFMMPSLLNIEQERASHQAVARPGLAASPSTEPLA